MALNDQLESLKTAKNNILSAETGDIPEEKRFDRAYVHDALAPMKPLKKITKQCLTLEIENEALINQINGMHQTFNAFNPLITKAKQKDKTTGWFCFKKMIPGDFYVKKQDADVLKNHLNALTPFTPSKHILALGEQVLALKTLADEEATHQATYLAFRDLYIALYEEEAERKKEPNPKKNTDYRSAAHKRMTKAHIDIAKDIVKHGGIPPKFNSLHRMKKEFDRLNTEIIRPKVRVAIAIVAGALIGAAIGLGFGLLMGGVTAIPAMFAGALLCGTLCGMGVSTAMVPLIAAPVTFFHASHKIKRHAAHQTILANEKILSATNTIKGLG